jgi:spectrin beta
LKQKEVKRTTEERRRNEKQQKDVNGYSESSTPIFSSPQVMKTPKQMTPQQQQQHEYQYSPQQQQKQYTSQEAPALSPATTGLQLSQSSEALASAGSSVQKSNSFATLLGERLRRGSEGNNIKRAESMKVVPKQAKRTPSFKTRRRAHSFRKNQKGEAGPANDLLQVRDPRNFGAKTRKSVGRKKSTGAFVETIPHSFVWTIVVLFQG